MRNLKMAVLLLVMTCLYACGSSSSWVTPSGPDMRGVQVSVAVPLSKQQARPSSFRDPRSSSVVNQPDQFMTVTLSCVPEQAEVQGVIGVVVRFILSSPSAPIISLTATARGFEEDGTYLSDQDLVINDGVSPGEDPVPNLEIVFDETLPPSVTRVCLDVFGVRLQPFPFGGPRPFPFFIQDLCTPQNLEVNLACNTPVILSLSFTPKLGVWESG
jgi:hypothetical protein